ncbi:hypothetical protein BGZ94_008304 [Podila epigama]|nr:hypothetical protein BGZ94_008304 [Podila epigama]
MPASPKSPIPIDFHVRRSHKRRCLLQKKIAIFTAIVLTCSAGSFILLQFTIGPPTPSPRTNDTPAATETVFWRPGRLQKWDGTPNVSRTNISLKSALAGHGDSNEHLRPHLSRPRVALPRQSIYNEAKETNHIIHDDSSQLQPFPQQPQNEAVPFEVILERGASSHADDTKFLLALPYAGMTNQFYGMLRALYIAQSLGRSLLLPPLAATTTRRDRLGRDQIRPENQPWSKFLDLKRFTALTGVKIVELHEVMQRGESFRSSLDCHVTTEAKANSRQSLDTTASAFLTQWGIEPSLLPLSSQPRPSLPFVSPTPSWTPLDVVIDALTPHQSKKYLCLTNSFKIDVPGKTEWERFGQHFFFTAELEKFARRVLERHFISNALPTVSLSMPSSQQSRSRTTNEQDVMNAAFWSTHPFITVHARRRPGFETYCRRFSSGDENFHHCYPSTNEFAERIRALEASRIQNDPSLRPLPVMVVTDEYRQDELARFTALGWKVLDHRTLGTTEVFGAFGPMMVDQVFLAHAHILVGNQMSSFSRVGSLRQLDWHDRQTEYM